MALPGSLESQVFPATEERYSAVARTGCSRYRLPSEDDDVFGPHPLASIHAPNTRVDRNRLVSDDDVFFRPRARLSSSHTPLFPRTRLSSASDSSVFVPRHWRFRERQMVSLQQQQQPRDTSSIQLNNSQYTADDTPGPVFKTPHTRLPTRGSSEVPSLVPNNSSCNLNSGSSLEDPPFVTRTPFAWISPNLSNIPCPPNVVSMTTGDIKDVRQRLFHQVTSTSISPPEHTLKSFVPITSTPQEPEFTTNVALSFLQEEMSFDSGFSSLPSFDGTISYASYQQRFEDKLAAIMVEILTSVEASISPVQDHQLPLFKTSLEELSSTSCEVSPSLTTVVGWSPRLLSPPEIVFYPSTTSSLGDQESMPLASLLESQVLDPASMTPNSTSSLPSLNFSWQPSSMSKPRKTAQCPVCNKVLASASGVKAHMRCHTGEKPYLCPFCSRRFSDKTTFRRHKTLHTGKLFKCVHCNKTYTTHRDLKNHVQRFH